MCDNGWKREAHRDREQEQERAREKENKRMGKVKRKTAVQLKNIKSNFVDNHEIQNAFEFFPQHKMSNKSNKLNIGDIIVRTNCQRGKKPANADIRINFMRIKFETE